MDNAAAMRGLLAIALCLSLPLAVEVLGSDLPHSKGEPVSSPELNFRNATKKHHDDLRDLERSRGISVRNLQEGISLQSLAKTLSESYSPGTAVLLYDYQESVLRSWLVDQSGLLALSETPTSTDDLSSAISRLRLALKVDVLQQQRAPRRRGAIRQKEAESRPSLERAIGDLSQILVPKSLSGPLTAVRHLVIVPVLGIGTVPWTILKPPKWDSPLIERMSVSIAPSIHDVERAAEYPSWNWHSLSERKEVLVVGNPLFPENTGWEFPPLPGAEQEAIGFGKRIGAPILVGAEATKSAVVQSAEYAPILYLATHGVASPDDPLDGSFLVFSPDGKKEWQWTAHEIQSMELGADLAVLSACQTGLGKAHDAGIIGLARAFQIAGVPRVVMSLWSVDDHATTELMGEFAEGLAKGTPAEALREAMLRVRSRRPNPAEWASFVFFGTSR